MAYTKFGILNNGNLKITLTDEGTEYLNDLDKDEEGKFKDTDDNIFLDLIEYHICNGYTMVRPEQIGALTEANIISDGIIDEETTKEEFENTKFWYFNEYMIISELQSLLNAGYVTFTKAD